MARRMSSISRSNIGEHNLMRIAMWLVLFSRFLVSGAVCQQVALQENTTLPVPGRAKNDIEPIDFIVKTNRIECSIDGQRMADYVFRDDKILRPYFANVTSKAGVPLSRNHPPQNDRDATDHDTMHPGVWLAFGDINGSDFWRNQAKIEHVRFTINPSRNEHAVIFASESRLVDSNAVEIGSLLGRIELLPSDSGWMLIWNATFQATNTDLVFGDQEEMGFGARVATPIIEKSGGIITNSDGKLSAKSTWGQPADWSDYSGTIDGHPVGLTVMASPKNFRRSWWHNRDYGLTVANPFGRAAMQQGEQSAVTVRRGDSMQLTYGLFAHDKADFNPKSAYESFVQASQ